MKNLTVVFTIFLVALATFLSCKKDKVVALEGLAVLGNGLVDVSWTFDKAHSNVSWESKYLDWSNGMLTGRFDNFNFNPKFAFNEADLNACGINAWVQLSSIDSGEPGRDGP